MMLQSSSSICSNSKQTVANDCHTSEKVNKRIVYQVTYCNFEDARFKILTRCPTPVNRCLGVQFDRLYLRLHHSFSGSPSVKAPQDEDFTGYTATQSQISTPSFSSLQVCSVVFSAVKLVSKKEPNETAEV